MYYLRNKATADFARLLRHRAGGFRERHSFNRDNTAHVLVALGRMAQGSGASNPNPTRTPDLPSPAAKRSWEQGLAGNRC